jgi:hypothetical protein
VSADEEVNGLKQEAGANREKCEALRQKSPGNKGIKRAAKIE